jgi:predicted transcriptional regulator
MANRGSPLPFVQRQQIKELTERRVSERRAALLAGVSRNTVRKYRAKKFEPPHAKSA